MISSQDLKPGEGMKFLRPDKTEAAVFIAEDWCNVKTFERDNRVSIEINFKNAFIHPTDKRPRHVKRGPNCS